MRNRLLLLLVAWPSLARADPHYGDYGFIIGAIQLLVLGAMTLVVAQVVGRVLRWLMRRRFNLWLLTMASLTGCWLGVDRPLNFNRPEPEPLAKGMVSVAGPSSPHPPPSVQYLAASSAGAVILTAVATAAITFLEQRNQYPEQET